MLEQVAGAFGTALFVTVAALGSAAPSGTPDASGLRMAFVVAAGLGVLAFATALFVRRARTAQPEQEPARA